MAYSTNSCPDVDTLLCLPTVFGVDWFYKQDRFFDPDSPFYRPDWSRSVSDGMHYTWLGNNFGWQFFAVSRVSIAVGI
jgi:hypothetical protein